jgi:hypothetical protein
VDGGELEGGFGGGGGHDSIFQGVEHSFGKELHPTLAVAVISLTQSGDIGVTSFIEDALKAEDLGWKACPP